MTRLGLVLALLLAPALGRAQPMECDDAIRAPLGREGGLACAALGGGRVLVAAVSPEEYDDRDRRSVRLVVGIVGPGEHAIWRQDDLTRLAARRELPSALGYLDDTRFLPTFGSIQRLSTVWQYGEDEATRTEIQVWLRVTGERITSLWTGRGNGMESHFGQCVTTRVVEMRAEGSAVVRSWTVETSFTEQGIHQDIPIEQRRRDCGPGTRRVGPVRSPMRPRRLRHLEPS